MIILSFDISSISTGCCVLKDGYVSKKLCTTINPPPKKQMGERLNYFAIAISDMIEKYKPDQIIIEDIFRGRNVNTFKVLAQFRGVAIQKIYELTGKDPISLMAVGVRKLIGCGTDKESAFKFINKKYKLRYNFEKDNDKTDAIALALAALEMERQGLNEKSIRGPGRRKKRKRVGNKKSVSKTSSKTPSRSKPKQPKRRK